MTVSNPRSVDSCPSTVLDVGGIPVEESTLPDLYVLLSCQDTSGQFRTTVHTNIAGNRLPDSNWTPATTDEWLRDAIGEYLRAEGIEVCHPHLPTSGSVDETDWEQIPDGYHKPGTCVHDNNGCLLHEACGGPTAQQLKQHQVTFSSLPELTTTGSASIHGVWKLTFGDLRPEYVALVTEAISSSTVSDTPSLSIGGDQTLDVDLTSAYVINPLYTVEEVGQAIQHTQERTVQMATKGEFWRETVRDQLNQTLSERLDEIRSNGGESDGH